MKNWVLFISILFAATSCSTLKRGSASSSAVTTGSSGSGQGSGPRFLNSISIKAGGKRRTTSYAEPMIAVDRSKTSPPVSIEILYPAQFKYAILLDVPVEEMLDLKLIDFLEKWYGTPYRLGGDDKSGIDCSAFVQTFLQTLYGIHVPRTSMEQYNQCHRVDRNDLQEGDLVFFHTERHRKVSHVGIYLRNNKFVHASASSGVMISDLDEGYFARRYVGAGRYTESQGAVTMRGNH